MKRLFLFIVLSIFILSVKAQIKQKNYQYGFEFVGRVQIDSAVSIPYKTMTGIKDFNAGYDTAQLFYRKSDSSILVYTGSQWIAATGSSTNAWNKTGNSITSGQFIGTTNSEDFVVKTNNTERARIISSGNVGIGTNNPLYTLDVSGDGHFTGDIYVNSIFMNHGGGGFAPYNQLITAGHLYSFGSQFGLSTRFGILDFGLLSTDHTYQLPDNNGQIALLSDITTPDLQAVTDQGAVTTSDIVVGGDVYLGRGPGNVATNVVAGANGLASNVSGTSNIAIGTNALLNNTSGSTNTAVGYETLKQTTTSSGNTALGYHALKVNTSGQGNAGIGYEALLDNVTGSFNTALGAAMRHSISSYNTAAGYLSLDSNSADLNTAVGYAAMRYNNTGEQNSAFGVNALLNNRTGIKNVAIGAGAMENNRTGSFNVGVGQDALLHDSIGSANIGIGWLAMSTNTVGQYNVSLGYQSGRTLTSGDRNVFIGSHAGFNGSQKVDAINTMALGDSAYTTADNQVVIGNRNMTTFYGFGVANASNTSGKKVLMIGGDNQFYQIAKDSVGGSGSSQWTTTGSDIYYNTGNVGIGTSSPSDKLVVTDGTNTMAFKPSTTNLSLSGTSSSLSAGPKMELGFNSDANKVISFFAYTHDNFALTFDAYHNGTNWISSSMSGNFAFYKYFDELIVGVNSGTSVGGSFPGGFDLTNSLRIKATGKVGVGVAATARLHIGAGASSANNAALKFDSGTYLSSTEAGTQEYDGSFAQTKASGLRYTQGGVIADFITDVSNSGTSETDLYTYTTPASTLANNGEKIQASITINHTDATADKQDKIYFAGNVIWDSGVLTAATSSMRIEVLIIRTGSSTARSIVSSQSSTGLNPVETDITGITFTNTNIIKATGQASGAGGGSGDITAKMGTIYWWPAAHN